jgi:hypothetical protein
LPSPPIPISERERGKGMRDTNKEKWYHHLIPVNPEVLNVEKSRTKFDILDKKTK